MKIQKNYILRLLGVHWKLKLSGEAILSFCFAIPACSNIVYCPRALSTYQSCYCLITSRAHQSSAFLQACRIRTEVPHTACLLIHPAASPQPCKDSATCPRWLPDFRAAWGCTRRPPCQPLLPLPVRPLCPLPFNLRCLTWDPRSEEGCLIRALSPCRVVSTKICCQTKYFSASFNSHLMNNNLGQL